MITYCYRSLTFMTLSLQEFDSRLSIGTTEKYVIEMRGETGRQYITYPEGGGSPVVKFAGVKDVLRLKRFYLAFGLTLRNDFLMDAIFPENVVFGYNSIDEGKRVVQHTTKNTIML